jgi:uncharacterized membrane protein
MGNLMTMLSGAALGAGTMYLMDPDRGHRRRAELREALAEVGDSELADRARRLQPMTTVRELGGSLVAARWPLLATLASRRGRPLGLRRRRATALGLGDWALLGGFAAAIGAGLWLVRRTRGADRGIEVVRTLTVEAPVERVYEFWNDFENFPRFMSHLREVRRAGPDRTHWIVNGPGGAPIEWDAVVTRRVPNEEIAWRTEEGSVIEHEGSVRFRPAGAGATRVEVRMVYRPLGGPLGQGVAALLGHDPERVLADDLSRVASQLRGSRPAVGESGQRR